MGLRVGLFCFLLGTSGLGFGETWTPEALLSRLLAENLDLKAEISMVAALNAEASAQGGDFMPLKFTYNLMNLDSSRPGDLESAEHRFALSQDIPWTGRTFFQAEKARTWAVSRDLSRHGMEREKTQSLLTDLVQISVQKKILENLEHQSVLLNQILESAKIQYSNARVSFASLMGLEINSADLEGEKLLRSERMAVLSWEIQELTGVAEKDFRIEMEPLKVPDRGWPPVDRDFLRTKTLTDNPLLGSLGLVIASSEAGLALEKTKSFPDLGLMAEAVYQPGNNRFTLSFGAEVGLPVLGAWGTASRIDAVSKEVLSRSDQKKALEFSLNIRLNNLFIARESLIRQLNLYEEKSLKASEENLAHMLREYQTQGTDFNGVTEAFFGTYEMKNRYWALLGELYGVYYELEALSGQKIISKE